MASSLRRFPGRAERFGFPGHMEEGHLMHGHFRTDAAVALIVVGSLSALAAGCGSGSATAERPASIAIVDLFSQDGVEVSDSPTLSTAPRAAWRFADPAPSGLPEATAATRGWTSYGDVTDLTVSDGRLIGETNSDFPILHVSWDDDQGQRDDLHSVEISLSVSAGENLEVTFQDSDTPDVEGVREADWDLDTPIIPGDEIQTYTLANEGGTDTSDIRQIFHSADRRERRPLRNRIGPSPVRQGTARRDSVRRRMAWLVRDLPRVACREDPRDDSHTAVTSGTTVARSVGWHVRRSPRDVSGQYRPGGRG